MCFAAKDQLFLVLLTYKLHSVVQQHLLSLMHLRQALDNVLQCSASSAVGLSDVVCYDVSVADP